MIYSFSSPAGHVSWFQCLVVIFLELEFLVPPWWVQFCSSWMQLVDNPHRQSPAVEFLGFCQVLPIYNQIKIVTIAYYCILFHCLVLFSKPHSRGSLISCVPECRNIHAPYSLPTTPKDYRISPKKTGTSWTKPCNKNITIIHKKSIENLEIYGHRSIFPPFWPPFFRQVTWIQLVPQILHHAASAAVVVTGGRAAVRHIAGPGARTFQSENLGGDPTLKETHRKPIGNP